MASRYLAPPSPDTAGKIVTQSEIAGLLQAGLDVMLNWEWYESRATEGSAAGYQDGTAARQMSEALGYPAGAAIYFSCDMDTRNFAATNAYFAAARSALGGRYRMGAYGGFNVVNAAHNAGVVDLSWQTVAWSYGHVCSRSSLYQTGDRVWFGSGNECDVNIIRGAYYGWQSAGRGGRTPLNRDWFDMATQADLEKIIDARLQYYLPRLAAMLRSGKPNAAFAAQNAGGLIDNHGLDGLIRSSSAFYFIAVDKTGKPADGRVWVLVGDRILHVPNLPEWNDMDPSHILHRLPETHPFFKLTIIS
jgi:glycoside hydrolase-like protein